MRSSNKPWQYPETAHHDLQQELLLVTIFQPPTQLRYRPAVRFEPCCSSILQLLEVPSVEEVFSILKEVVLIRSVFLCSAHIFWIAHVFCSLQDNLGHSRGSLHLMVCSSSSAMSVKLGCLRVDRGAFGTLSIVLH